MLLIFESIQNARAFTKLIRMAFAERSVACGASGVRAARMAEVAEVADVSAGMADEGAGMAWAGVAEEVVAEVAGGARTRSG